EEHRRHGEGRRTIAARHKPQHLRRRVEVEERLGDAPEKDARRDRGAQGDREPAPTAEQRPCVGSTDDRPAEGRERYRCEQREKKDARGREDGSEAQQYPVVERGLKSKEGRPSPKACAKGGREHGEGDE